MLTTAAGWRGKRALAHQAPPAAPAGTRTTRTLPRCWTRSLAWPAWRGRPRRASTLSTSCGPPALCRQGRLALFDGACSQAWLPRGVAVGALKQPEQASLHPHTCLFAVGCLAHTAHCCPPCLAPLAGRKLQLPSHRLCAVWRAAQLAPRRPCAAPGLRGWRPDEASVCARAAGMGARGAAPAWLLQVPAVDEGLHDARIQHLRLPASACHLSKRCSTGRVHSPLTSPSPLHTAVLR